jgi:hypothetical protein
VTEIDQNKGGVVTKEWRVKRKGVRRERKNSNGREKECK